MNSYQSSLCDEAYRRGFDHALAFVMQDCGLTQSQINEFKYKKRVVKWKRELKRTVSKTRTDPPRMSRDEAKQFVSYLNSAFWNEQGDQINA